MKKKIKKWLKKVEKALKQSQCMHLKNEIEILEIDIAQLKASLKRVKHNEEKVSIEKVIEIKEKSKKEFEKLLKELNC